MAKISRTEVIKRAATLWPLGSVPYNQGALDRNTGYRQDCSGFVSMCWGIPANATPGGWGGLNTVTLVTGGYMKEINLNDLKTGDAIGICGPNTGGDSGHIVLFENWLNDDPNDDRYWLWEQAGGQRGPVRRLVEYPYGGPIGQWKAYRFVDIVNDGGTIPTTPTPTPGGNMSDWDEKLTIEGTERTMRGWLGQTWGISRDSKARLDTVIAKLDDIDAKLDAVVGILEELPQGGGGTSGPTAREVAAELIAQLSPRA